MQQAKRKKARIGFAGYAKVLAGLRAKPATYVEAEAQLGITHSNVHRIVNGFYALGRVHVVAWVQEPDRPTKPRFGFGPGPDAPAPTTRPDGRPASAKPVRVTVPPPELVAFDSLLRALESPASPSDVARETGLAILTVRRALAALKALKLVHIALWTYRERGSFGGPPIPNYVFGRGSNAPRPKPMLHADRARLYRARVAQRQAAQPLATLAVQWRGIHPPTTAGQPA